MLNRNAEHCKEQENREKFRLLSFFLPFSFVHTFVFLISGGYNGCRNSKEVAICEIKYYIALDDFERQVVVNCLNEMRNSLIANGKYTDAVDEILLKIIDAKQKKFKVIYKEA